MDQILQNVPKITLFLLGSSLLLSALTSFNVLFPSLYYLSPKIFSHYEFWRPLTSFLYYGKFSFGTFLHTLMLFSSSKNMELSGSAQYLYFVLIVYFSSLLVSVFTAIPLISDVFFMALSYVTSRRNRESKIAIMGLPVQVSAAYIPYLFLALGFNYARVAGMIIGHIYYFFEDIYPKLPNSRNYRIFNCPAVFFRISDYLRL